MIKKREPFPFETIAVAVAFSPRIEAILCEGRKHAMQYNAKLILIHVGDKTLEKQRLLEFYFKKYHFEAVKHEIVWRNGDTVNSILEVCKENVVDLLIAGALEKESMLKYYIGSVSREICRKAKCSVLMLTEPSVNPKSFKRIIVNGIDHPKTPLTVATSVYVAKHEKAEKVIVVKEMNTDTLTMAMADDSTEPELNTIKENIRTEETNRIEGLLNGIDKTGISVETKSITGKLGYSIGNYAATHGADLLVINSPDTSMNILDRLFTHDIEYILADLPCNLLIVHSRL